MLARAGRFWGLYKRAGHRVLVNANGDLIVRPTFIEAAAQLMRPWGGRPLQERKEKRKVYAGRHGLWEVLDRPMASWPLKGAPFKQGQTDEQ